MDLKSTIEEKVHVKIAPKTAAGNPATLDGTPVWAADAPATVEVDADGLGAFIVSGDTEGSSNWSVTADADLGEGVKNLVVEGVYTYGPAEANDLGVTVDTAVPK